MNQDNYFAWDEIPDMNVLPGGTLHFNVDELTDDESSSGKRMFRARFSVVLPVEFAGMVHFENYVTGSDEAPKALLPGSFGTRNMKAMMKAAQVPPNNDVALLCAGAANTQFLAKVSQVEEKEGDYKGTLRNRINAYFRIGERQVEIDVVKGTGAAAAAPVAVASPVVAPVVAALASAPAPAPTGTPGPPTTSAAAPPTPDPSIATPAHQPVSTPVPPVAVPTAPVATPVVVPVVSTGTPPTGPPAPTTETPAPAGPQMECMACKAAGNPGMMVGVADFSAHMGQFHAMGGTA